MSRESQTQDPRIYEPASVPSRLHHYQQTGDLHFITFSCYRRQDKLGTPAARATALQALKQSVWRTLALRQAEPFWEQRYYDFNVWTEKKRVEKLRYLHRNPVLRGLVAKPQDWEWSSFRHYATGAEGIVEIESEWTARRREDAARDAMRKSA